MVAPKTKFAAKMSAELYRALISKDSKSASLASRASSCSARAWRSRKFRAYDLARACKLIADV
jgi:hypothetical protein